MGNKPVDVLSLKQVYRYWISKADNKMHKEIAYIEPKTDLDRKFYIVYDQRHKVLDDINKKDFDENMLKRSVWQSIYLFKANDELAKKHFSWALSESIKSQEEKLLKYKSILKNL